MKTDTENGPVFPNRTPEEKYIRNKLYKDYMQLVKECEDNGEHLRPNKKTNLCKHCYGTLVFPKTREELSHESEMKEREKLPEMMQPYDAPIWFDKIQDAKRHQKNIDIYEGFERYLNSLKK